MVLLPGRVKITAAATPRIARARTSTAIESCGLRDPRGKSGEATPGCGLSVGVGVSRAVLVTAGVVAGVTASLVGPPTQPMTAQPPLSLQHST
jgi:hypothetical protein